MAQEANNVEIINLQRQRGCLKTKLTLFEKYLNLAKQKTVERNFEQQDTFELESRLNKIEIIINEFDVIQYKLDCLIETDNDERESFENRYYSLSACAKSIISKNVELDQKSNISPTQSLDGSIRNYNINLPKINLPVFHGDYEKWLEYHDTFKSMIHNQTSIGNIQKFHYLKASLRGEAAQLISAIELSENNYSLAWDLLCNRFENKRLLTYNHIKAIFCTPKIEKESSTSLRNLVDCTSKHLRALDTLIPAEQRWDAVIIYLIVSKLDLVTIREWEKYKIEKDLPTFGNLQNFLKNKADILETIELNHSPKSKDLRSNSERFRKTFFVGNENCSFCKGDHKIYVCENFLKLSEIERFEKVKSNRICIKCLKFGHFVSNCKSNTSCRICNKPHNTLLHMNRENATNISSESDSKTILTNHIRTESDQVLLGTVAVHLFDSLGKPIKVRALLDSGSQSNLITSSLCNSLGLYKKRTDTIIVGINKEKSTALSMCNVKINSLNNNFSYPLSCFVVGTISDNLPNKGIDVSWLKIPKNLQLADPDYNSPGRVDLLLGADAFWDLLSEGQIKLGKNLPCLQNTSFGWIVSGRVPNQGYQPSIRCNFVQEVDINNQLKKFWELEECTKERALSNEELACEKHFDETTRRGQDGRFIVSIPLKEKLSKLGDSRQRALKQFFSLERKLEINPILKKRYSEFMSEYASLGHMKEVVGNDTGISYYLPHHGVTREQSSTTKLRVVFNASAETTAGVSFNQLQMVGPVVQNDLFSILIRFRQHVYVVAADIEKMYRQFHVQPSQHSLQRIFWRENKFDKLKEYELTTLTYGTASAPYLATRCVKQLSIENEKTLPEASKIISDDFYVDDMMTGFDNIDEAKLVCNQIINILEQGCLKLRKWLCNEPDILSCINDSRSTSTKLEFGENENIKTLGVFWAPQDDKIMYSICDENLSCQTTKRSILSNIAHIFDPLGLLAVCTITAKIILQKLWLEKLSWDDPIPSKLSEKWMRFRKGLTKLNNIEISRRVICIKPTNINMHVFCDASIEAYGACIYIVSENNNNQLFSNLLCAKSKVAPLSVVSVPRLELCAAQLAVRLATKAIKSSRIKFNTITLWSDSTIVLNWIRISPNLLKTFVCNRVAEIQNFKTDCIWRHVQSKDNPADMLSRGIDPTTLMDNTLWWYGPEWLTKPYTEWPESNWSKNVELPEVKGNNDLLVNVIQVEIDFINKFSKLNRLKYTMVYILRFINNCRKSLIDRVFGPPSVDELAIALLALIKLIQRNFFAKEYECLSKSLPISSKSKILSLSPILDQKGILRVGGRLTNSSFDYEMIHPIILPANHHFTLLLLREAHEKLLHAGPQQMLASIREQYWPIHGRNMAKRVVHQCVICFRANPKSLNPIMGNLPKERVTPTFPFAVTGVDYAGPFTLRDKKGRGYKSIKAYVSIFICFTTKAIHLELVSDLTKEAFIATLRRFVARRGKPKEIFSDNGTNFVGTNNSLREMKRFIDLNKDSLMSHFAEEGIKWKFIPPYSPHMGGLWEAGVKSFKFHFKRVCANALLTFEEFYTVLSQIEAILNSRPLSPLLSDPKDLSPLTPAHFLIGRSLTSVVDPDVTHIPDNRMSTYQRIQQIQQHFWTRWSKEYLSSLQQRSKWQINQHNIKIGDIVIVKEDNLPPLCWLLGRVEELHPGQDNIVRVVSLRTSKGIIRRSFPKLCPLPSESAV